MDELEAFISELKKLSNLDHCQSARDMQNALEKINDRLNEEFPGVLESE